MQVSNYHTADLGQVIQQDPCQFIGIITRVFAEANDATELNDAIGELMSSEVIDTMAENADLLFVLSIVMSDAIKRIVFKRDEIIFPDRLMVMPPIFQGLGWADSHKNKWEDIHYAAVQRFEESPNLDEAVVLLFLEGMIASLNEAMFFFMARAEQLSLEEYDKAVDLAKELWYFGWPEVDSYAAAAVAAH